MRHAQPITQDDSRTDLHHAIRRVLQEFRCTAVSQTMDAVEALMCTDPPLTIAEAVRQLRDREPWLFDEPMQPVESKPLCAGGAR